MKTETLLFETGLVEKMTLHQKCFGIVLLFYSILCSNCQYYLYDDDCLDYYTLDNSPSSVQLDFSYRTEHQTIPFCRRDNFADDQIKITALGILSMTFEELKRNNISDLQLLMWQIHMDLIEEYQAFRETETVASNFSIYNCSSIQKFGRYCQYSFEITVSLHFLD